MLLINPADVVQSNRAVHRVLPVDLFIDGQRLVVALESNVELFLAIVDFPNVVHNIRALNRLLSLHSLINTQSPIIKSKGLRQFVFLFMHPANFLQSTRVVDRLFLAVFLFVNLKGLLIILESFV
jgi:hypothetical protein